MVDFQAAFLKYWLVPALLVACTIWRHWEFRRISLAQPSTAAYARSLLQVTTLLPVLVWGLIINGAAEPILLCGAEPCSIAVQIFDILIGFLVLSGVLALDLASRYSLVRRFQQSEYLWYSPMVLVVLLVVVIDVLFVATFLS